MKITLSRDFLIISVNKWDLLKVLVYIDQRDLHWLFLYKYALILKVLILIIKMMSFVARSKRWTIYIKLRSHVELFLMKTSAISLNPKRWENVEIWLFKREVWVGLSKELRSHLILVRWLSDLLINLVIRSWWCCNKKVSYLLRSIHWELLEFLISWVVKLTILRVILRWIFELII